MSLHTWHCQGPRKPSSCATFILNSHWGRAATGKKVLRLCVQEQPCGLWPARLLSEGFSRQKYWSVVANTVVIPFWSTIFPATLATNSPEYLVLPKRLQPKQLHHLHT